MSRASWFFNAPPSEETSRKGVDARKSSASLRRLTGESLKSNRARRWGWSRSETERLVRLQAAARGWLLRRKVCRIPARDVEAVLKDLHLKDKGLRRLVGYLCFFLLFFAILLLESDVSFQHSVEMGIRKVIDQVGSGPDDLRLSDVGTREEFSAWAISLFLTLYDGSELEDVCNMCAALRQPDAASYFPEISEVVWGTDVPLAGNATDGNDSFIFEFDSCPLCYGTERDAVLDGGEVGVEFCEMCVGMEYCFEEECADYDEARQTLGDVKGTNASLVKVSSNADCLNASAYDRFPRGFGANVGMTSVVAAELEIENSSVTLKPAGRGYVANKNKMVGALGVHRTWSILNSLCPEICGPFGRKVLAMNAQMLLTFPDKVAQATELLADWTYYEDGECDNTYKDSFYSNCYSDSGNSEEVQVSAMNQFGLIDINEGSKGEGLVYSVTTDVGLYDVGLNIGLCTMLSIFGGSGVITDAVRTASLRFNTYNGQKDGLFSSVDITAKFSLGGEVQITKDVQVFSMPYFFASASVVVCRAVAMFAFTVMLAHYIGKDLKHLVRELKDGRHRLKISFRRIPITTATIVHFAGDAVFSTNLVLWISTAVTASKFVLTPTLSYNDASEQVRAFSEDLSIVAIERWKRDAAAVAGSMIGLARLFIMLRFHPRLSLVTDVLAASGVHLVHFFIMFFMVVGVYSNLGWVIFGPSSELFATWTNSFVTMTRVALGEFDSIYPGMYTINPSSAFIIIATYQTLQGILLLNIVISILLDGFQMVQKRSANSSTDTLRETVLTTLGSWRIRLFAACYAAAHRNLRAPRPRYWGSTAHSPAHNAIHGARWSSDKQRTTGGMSTTPSPAAAAIATSRSTSGDGARTSPTRNDALASIPNKHPRKLSVGSVVNRWGKGGKTGLTRGQRIAVSHRHYDIRTAVEVLRRWPLPEKAVWRKMRQIIGARRGTSV